MTKFTPPPERRVLATLKDMYRRLQRTEHRLDSLVVTQGAALERFLAPAGAIYETFPRWGAQASSAALTSGTVYLSAIALPAGLVVSNVTFVVENAVSVLAHGWYCLADSSRDILAVSADQTSGAWSTGAGTAQELAVAGADGLPVITSYSGLYYLGACVSAATGPQMAVCASLASGIAGIAPIACGTSSTGETVPLAVGTVLASITPGQSLYMHGWVS